MSLVINSNDPRRMCCGERPGDCRCHSTTSPGVNVDQPRHPHTGQYQGKTHIAAQRGASPDLEDDDLDAADQDEADEDDEDENINTPNPACCSPGGLCPDCEALKEYLSRNRSERSKTRRELLQRQPASNEEDEDDGDAGDSDGEDGDDDSEVENRRRPTSGDAEDEDDEECDEDDEECNDTSNRRQETTMNHRDDDVLYPPQTTRSILAANAAGKAEGSNADLIGDDDSDYGYAQAGTYGRDQRTVHSVSEVFGYPAGAGENLFGAGMSQDDLDAENAHRMQMGDLAERDLPPEQSVSPQRNPTRYASGQRVPSGVRQPSRPDSVTATRSAELVRHQRADILSQPSFADILIANQAERQQQHRYPTLGDLPSPPLID